MKKFLIFVLTFILICATGQAETTREYAAYLEEVLPDAAFTDIEVPGFVTDHLGKDYDFIARSDAKYGSYIAGVRRDSAPELPEDAYASIGGTFHSQVFQVLDNAGNIYYDFILGDRVQISAYDGLEHLIIHLDENQPQYIPFAPRGNIMFTAADAKLRAQMIYAREHGFSAENKNRPQLCMYLHSIDTWRAGATDQPYAFYLDIDMPEDLTGEKFLEEDELIQFTRIPIGLYVREDGDYLNGRELVVSQSGMKAVETSDPHRLYEAGPDYDILVNLAAEALGYRPGEADFLGKDSIRATLEWADNSVYIEDPGKLDAMFSKADFTVGSVNCPSPCFLTMEYADGSSASMAVAINSFDLFFYNGLYFTAGAGELLDLFHLKPEDLNINLFGG